MTAPSQYVQEWHDEFLELWPHRYDYIWAEHPLPGQRPQWSTESRHPLSDRLIRQGSYLYGVRFSQLTNYFMIDIDAKSPYHPRQDRFAIPRILAALEPVGLVASVVCSSSYSGGLHLYFPFQCAQKSYDLAIAIQTVLENAGFKSMSGQLELFPNAKPFSQSGVPSLYAAHRLPMQPGSYLMDWVGDGWQVAGGDQSTFVSRWKFAQAKNDLETQTLEHIIKTARQRRYTLSRKADKFLNDLNAEIEAGWTGRGQTNHLLGRITMRSYIFGHTLYAPEPLEGTALIQDIVRIAMNLPGYCDWCRHQHEIYQRAEDWASCIENSHYFHYGSDPKGKYKKGNTEPTESDKPSWNEQQSSRARERICAAIADLLNKNALPTGARARFKVLTKEYHVGGETLYNHKDLWHPECLIPPNPPATEDISEPSALSRNGSGEIKSFLYEDGRNSVSDKAFDSTSPPDQGDAGRNGFAASVEKPFASGPQFIQKVLFEIEQQRKAEKLAVKPPPTNADMLKLRRKQAQVAQMRQYIASGDPILIAEANAWFAANPDVAREEQLSLSDPSLDCN